MIQPAVPTPFPALSVLGEAPVLPASDGPDGADFGALLALQSVPTTPEGAGSAPQPTAATLTASVTLEPATTGKILPLDLPEAANGPQPAKLPVSLPASAAAALGLHPAKPATQPEKAAKSEPHAKKDRLPEPSAAVGETAPLPELPILAALPETAQQATPAAAPVIVEADDKPNTKPKPDHELTGQGAAHRTIPTLPATASAQAQAQMQRHAAQALAVVEPTMQTAQPVQQNPEPAATPAEQVRVELALPRIALAGALNRDEARPLAKLSDLALPDASSPLASSSTQQQPASAQASTPVVAPIAQVRPHDFAALIERIAVAREAAAPQAVSITVAHQDFGQVRLSFRPEDAGLSVAMSSADPGFARAAAAVPAPALSSTVSEQTGPGQNQRSDTSAAQTGGQSHSRGGSGDPRRDSQQQSPANPGPRSGRDRSASRTGIFA